MENKLKISVVTVVFNGEKTLEKTIQSVVNQTYSNIEYIIIDGASTDDTISIIKKYESKIALWLSKPDHGIYDAMNKGLQIATGDFLIFMGADDLFINNDVISNFVSKIKNSDSNRVYYGNVIKVSTKERYDGYFTKEKFAIKNICHQSIFYSKNIYKTNQYDLKYKLWADYVYNFKLFNQMEFIDIDVAYFNDEGASSRKGDLEFRKDVYYLVFKYLGIKCFFILLAEKIKRNLNKRLKR